MIEELSVPTLSDLCGKETDRYLRREPYAERFCVELFRRAIQERNDAAWAAVFTQYYPVVRRWLGAATDDETVTAAFERFWHAVDAAKFAHFGSLAAVLQYLKMCALSARLDAARSTRSRSMEEPLGEDDSLVGASGNVEDIVADQVQATQLWSAITTCLDDERERLTIYLSCVIGLTPRDICARHPSTYPSVGDVYRLKRNALDRLRRSPKLRALQ